MNLYLKKAAVFGLFSAAILTGCADNTVSAPA